MPTPEILSSPIPPPSAPGSGVSGYHGGFTQTNQAMLGNLSGGNNGAPPPTLPIGAGNTMYGADSFSQEDISGVGGVVGKKPEADTTSFIPTIPDPSEVDTQDFSDAYSKRCSYW